MPTSSPKHYTSTNLLSDIKQGRIKIPQFQREFVWERERSAKLLDSILKGYPLGTFILWQTKERLRAVRNIGGLSLPTPPEGEFTYQVLDGQQRMTSLVAAMEALKLKEDFGEICLDLDASPDSDSQLVFSSSKDLPPDHASISFRDLLAAGIAYLNRKFGANLEHLERIEHYQKQFNAYQFPAVVLEGAELSVATEIFTRLNVGGRSLTIFEIMVAKTWDEELGFDLLDRVKTLDTELATVNYGGMDHQLCVQLVSAIVTQNVRSKDILAMSRQQFIDAWAPSMTALRQAIDFCRSDLYIQVRALLPSERALIPLAYYFHLAKNNPAGERKKRLVDLFFRIGLSERYSSSSEARIAQDLKAVQEIFDGKQPIYDYGVNSSADHIKRNGHFRAGRAYIKTLLCILAAQSPRCFKTGGKVILDNALLKQKNSKNYHHFFPKAFLEKQEFSSPADHIANITFISGHVNKHIIRARAPSRYIPDFKQENPQLEECLHTHLIANGNLTEDQYDLFFDARCVALAQELSQRLIAQARDTQAPSLLSDEPEEDQEEEEAEA